MGDRKFSDLGGGIEFLVFKIIKGGAGWRPSNELCSMLYYAISNLLQFACEM